MDMTVIRRHWIGYNSTRYEFWGYIWLEPDKPFSDDVVQFSGSRFGILDIKSRKYDISLLTVTVQMNQSGYIRINLDELNELWPEFSDKFGEQLIWHELCKD